MATDNNNLLNAINTTDRDVLSTQLLQTQSLNNKTDILRDAINNTSRFTDDALNTINRDILKSSDALNDRMHDALGNNTRYIEDSIKTVNRDVLNGHSAITNEIKDKVDGATMHTHEKLSGIDKDIFTTSANQTEALKGDINEVNRDVLNTTAQLQHQINGQFYNNADRVDRGFSEIKSGLAHGFYATGQNIKDTQREIALATGNIEKHNSYLSHELFKELHHQHRHDDRRYGDLRHDFASAILRNENELLRSRNVIEVQAASNYANMQMEALKNKDALALQAANNYANIQTEALKNTQTMMSKMADCCCEIKETVLTTASATQGLIQNSEAAALRSQLQTEQTKNLILQSLQSSQHH